MTAKEKAKELLSAMAWVCRDNGNYPNVAKQCAKIAVEEAEKSEYNVLEKFGFVTKNYTSDYWQEVKKELEK